MATKSTPSKLVSKYDALLSGYLEQLKITRSPQQIEKSLASLVAGFQDARKKLNQTEDLDLQDAAVSRIEAVFDGYLEARMSWAETQRKSADDFNLLEVLGIQYDELCHSKILAWLLDRRIEQGTHAQGNLGFQALLEELGEELSLDRAYAEKPYWVRREVSCSESRVDIEIAAPGRDGFIIHIENKILSAEGERQTHREWSSLLERAEEIGVPPTKVHGVFLTRDRSPAESNEFRSIGWSRIVTVLEIFAAKAQPNDVKLFARHYARAVRRFAVATLMAAEIPNDTTEVQ
jgi:hypothetical protein